MSAGLLHHVEMNVSDLKKTTEFWSWFLTTLGYSKHQEWDQGISFKLGATYLVFVQAEEKYLSSHFHRKQVGLNHLAFHAASRTQVDEVLNELVERKCTILYPEKHPELKSSNYSVFFEDPDRIKVELVYQS